MALCVQQVRSYVSDMVDPNRNTVTKKLWSTSKARDMIMLLVLAY